MPKIKVIPLLEVIFKENGGSSDVWKAVSELLYYKEEEISVFCPYIKNKINSYDKDTSILALTLLDFCVDDGKMALWSALNTKNFLGSIINNLKTRQETDIQNMILYLIQKWGNKFSRNQELSNFKSVYLAMKKNNISFPTEAISDYSKYVKLPKKNKLANEPSFNNNSKTNKNNNNEINSKRIIVETDPEDYLKDINVNLETSSYDKIYKRLVNKLYDWTHAIHEVNVLINKNSDGKNNSKIEGLIKDLTKGNRQLVETIQSGKLKDKVLMEISLNVIDDINMTLSRWNNNKNGKPPGPFVSGFFQNDEWRNKKLNNMNNNNTSNNNNNNNFNNINDFYNVNNSILKNNFNNNNNNVNNTNQFINNINNNNSNIEQELKNYPKLYEKIRNSNINYNNNNSLQMNNFSKFEQNINNINNFQNNNNNNKSVSNNQGSFNLLIDFDSAPMPSSSNNKNNDLNLNLNDKNNMDKFVDFITMTEKQNEIKNRQNNNFENNSNNRNKFTNMDYNSNIFQNRNMNNCNNFYNDENKEIENPYNDRKFSNDNINNTKINKSVVYPSFEELEQSNSNNNTNINSNQIQKEEEDILAKFDF